VIHAIVEILQIGGVFKFLLLDDGTTSGLAGPSGLRMHSTSLEL